MNKESKKVLRRKLIVLGIMLAVLFGSIAVAGIAKRGDYLAVAHAEEVNPAEWEVVKTEYKFVGGTVSFDDSPLNSRATPSITINDGKIYASMTFTDLSVESGSDITDFPFLFSWEFGLYDNTNGNVYSTNLHFTPLANTCSVGDTVSGILSVSDFSDVTGSNFSNVLNGVVSAANFAYAGSSSQLFQVAYISGLTISETKYYKLPTAPEKEGYVFTGWYTDEACTNKYTGTTVTADTALYAGYEKQILTVTLDNDGATETMTVEYGNTVTLPDKTKDGYDFLGWYFSDDTKYVDQAITSNVTLTAKYRKKPVITLDNNGITETLTVEYNEAASLPTKTKTGYNFLGWFYSDGTKYDGQAVTSDLTLTAKFEVIMLKVRFFVDGVEYKTVDVPYGSSFSEAVEKASLKQSSVKSVIRLASVAGEGEETPADDQTLPEELTSDIKANVDVSALDTAKEQTTSWFKATWEKIADFFVNLWAKISSFFVTAWEAVCNHFRDNWKWYAIGGGSAAMLAIVIAVICKVRR